MSTTIVPPKGLPTGERVYPALVLPFGEPADPSHEDAGREFTWGEVYLPKRSIDVDVDHDGKAIGSAVGFTITPQGIWASLKLGDEGQRLVDRGHRGLSVELDSTGTIIAVSLVVAARPAFPSAAIWLDGRAPARGGYGHMTPVTVGVGSANPAPAFKVAEPMMRGTSDIFGPSPESEVERLGKWWRKRVEELRGADDADEAGRLVGAGVPMSQWPRNLPGRQRWETLQAQQVVAEGAVHAQEWAVRMAALEAAAERQSRPWWRWFR